MSPFLQKRILFLSSVLSLAFLGLTGRVWDLTIQKNSTNEIENVRQQVCQKRANLMDCQGVLLATNVRTFSVHANPCHMLDAQQAAKKLHLVFPELSTQTLLKRFQSRKQFVWLIRHITPQDKERVLRAGIPGVSIMEDQRRIWPHGALFSHVLGLTNVDQIGISGLEKTLNQRLRTDAKPVRLSLDVRVQHIVREELRQTIASFQAESGNALLVNLETGGIVACVSLPDFNPHTPSLSSSKALFNRNTTGVYEFGSLLKIHNTAMVLENRVAHLGSVYDASTPLSVGNFRITDFRGKNRPLTVQEAFLFSSNIVSAKMALAAGVGKQRAFFEKMGFNAPVPLEVPERTHTLLPTIWQEPTLMTASYGYGLAVTPFHMAQSIGAITTGIKRPLTFLQQATQTKGERVVSSKTAAQIRFLLREAATNGQAKNAAVIGYDVGAKTGTANLRDSKGRYMKGQNLTSCAIVFPIHKPKYLLLTAVERPKPNHLTHGFATAGWIAAPLAGKIVKQIAPILGILPQQARPTPQSSANMEHLLARCKIDR